MKPVHTTRVSATGINNALVLFAGFQGGAEEDSLAPAWRDDLFDESQQGSFSHFFAEMSRGALTVTGSALKKRYFSEEGPEQYAASSPTEEGEYARFCQEVVEAADAEIDFGQYDEDGDGYVDFLFIVVKGMPRNFIIGPAVGILGLGFSIFLTNDPGAGPLGRVCIENGTVLEEGNFHYTVGVMAHEYGHALGLPDLYDTTILDPEPPPEEDSAGIGVWGLMGYGGLGWHGDDGPNPFCAWSKATLGWIGTDDGSLVVVDENRTDLAIEDMKTGGAVYKIPITTTEYFLLVNRQRISFYNRNMPQTGLLVWHVEENGSNNDEERKKVDLECADGLFLDRGAPAGVQPDPEYGMDNLDFWSDNVSYRTQRYGNRGDATDIFDGERFTELTPETNPSSNGYDKSSRIAITNIRRQGVKMLVDVRLDFTNHHIVKNTDWSGDIQISRDVIVESGATLAIGPGTVVRFAPVDTAKAGVDPERCELVLRGELYIQRFSAPVTFTSAAPEPQTGDWYGIRLEGDSARVEMNECVVQYAKYGISGAGVSTSVNISKSTIQHNQQDGINLSYPWLSFITLSECTIQHNGSAGAKFPQGGVFAIRQCTISDNEWGIWGEGGKIEIDWSIIEANRQNGIHLGFWKGELRITNSQIRDNMSAGISLVHDSEQSGGVISKNVIANNSIGISTFSSSPRVEENILEGNRCGVRSEGESVPNLDGFNQFVDNNWAIMNLTEQEISAQDNWWGTADDETVASQITGPVSWNLYLRMDPDDIEKGFLMGQNFPNPFSFATQFWYQIPVVRTDPQRDYRVIFTLYNILGQQVRRLFDDQVIAGPHSLSWDGRDDRGRKVASGVYIYRLVTEGFTKDGKVALSK